MRRKSEERSNGLPGVETWGRLSRSSMDNSTGATKWDICQMGRFCCFVIWMDGWYITISK